MTSACELRFDDLAITAQKEFVPDEFIFLFQESDRKLIATPEDSEEAEFVGYIASRAIILKRLELVGITPARAASAFNAFLADQLETYRSVASSSSGDLDWSAHARTIEAFSYSGWQARIRNVLETRYTAQKWRDQSYADEIERRMHDLDDEWIFFADPLTSIRAMLDALPEIKEVFLNVGPLIDGGWIEPDDQVCTARRQPQAQPRSILQPVVLLAEGSTDNRVLLRSLERLYPHLADYITFFDYEGARADGGASYVVKFLKAFTAARVNTFILALFDNDAAGGSAFKSASDLILPANIKCTMLPETDLARDYPTIGPQGEHSLDVNGKAASIELYLGKHNLALPDGRLTPITWAGYRPEVKCYQGEVANKSEIFDRFMRDTAVHCDATDYKARFPELDQVWRHIFQLIRVLWTGEEVRDA